MPTRLPQFFDDFEIGIESENGVTHRGIWRQVEHASEPIELDGFIAYLKSN